MVFYLMFLKVFVSTSSPTKLHHNPAKKHLKQVCLLVLVDWPLTGRVTYQWLVWFVGFRAHRHEHKSNDLHTKVIIQSFVLRQENERTE